MQKLFITFVLLILCSPLFASSQSYIDKRMGLFFTHLKTNSSDAVDQLLKGTTYAKDNKEEIVLIKAQLKKLESKIGHYISHQELIERNLVNRYIHVEYLALYDEFPVIFHFQFYRPKDEWEFHGFQATTTIDELIRSSADLGVRTKMQVNASHTRQ